MEHGTIALIISLMMAVFIVASLLLERANYRWKAVLFEQKFPPITDAEFVARCSPGTSSDIALRVRRIIAETTGVPYECIHQTMNFIGDLE